MLRMTLQYDGGLADNNEIDFYDASRALIGFERSLALVTHLALNGEIITQATALDGAQIIVQPPEEGSWKVVAAIVGGLFAIGSVGRDSPIGQVVTSIYDYVLYETMGFHVDYDKTLQQQHAEYLREKKIRQEKIDSLIEKTESSIADIHRPIVASRTATQARIFGRDERSPPRQLGPEMSALTYEYIAQNIRSDDEESEVGVVSSYNLNTFKGRVFILHEQRPIPFELAPDARTGRNINLVTRSLRLNGANKDDRRAIITMTGYRIESRTGRLKKLLVESVSSGGTVP